MFITLIKCELCVQVVLSTYLVNSCFYGYFVLIFINIANLVLFKNLLINFRQKLCSESPKSNLMYEKKGGQQDEKNTTGNYVTQPPLMLLTFFVILYLILYLWKICSFYCCNHIPECVV